MTTYTVRSTSDSHYGIFATLESAEQALRMVRRIDPDAQIFVAADWRDRALAAEAAIARVREFREELAEWVGGSLSVERVLHDLDTALDGDSDD